MDTFTSADGLPDDFIRSLLIDTDGSLWIGTRRGLAHWSLGKSGSAMAGMKTYTKENGLGSDLVGAMARDARGDFGWRRWRGCRGCAATQSKLHDREWAFKQRGDGAPASRRWHIVDRYTRAWMGCLERAEILAWKKTDLDRPRFTQF